MACINMFNPEHHQSIPMSPRISFSNDFAVEQPKHERPIAPPDPDFEFAVGGRPMMAADELFFKGRLLPLRESCTAEQLQRVTLRDELLAGEDDEEWGAASSSAARPLRGRWKELLGLRKGAAASKKHYKGEERAAATLVDDDAAMHAAKAPTLQELRGEAGSRLKEAEFSL